MSNIKLKLHKKYLTRNGLTVKIYKKFKSPKYWTNFPFFGEIRRADGDLVRVMTYKENGHCEFYSDTEPQPLDIIKELNPDQNDPT